MDPLPAAVPGPHLDPQLAANAIAAMGETTGLIQAHLADTLGAAMAAQQKSQKLITSRMNRGANTALKYANDLTGRVVTQLGEGLGTALTAGKESVASIGAAAAGGFSGTGGGAAPVSPSAPAAPTPIADPYQIGTFLVWVRCLPGAAPQTQLLPYDPTTYQTTLGNGWSIANAFTDINTASAWVNSPAFQTQLLIACQPGAPPIQTGTVSAPPPLTSVPTPIGGPQQPPPIGCPPPPPPPPCPPVDCPPTDCPPCPIDCPPCPIDCPPPPPPPPIGPWQLFVKCTDKTYLVIDQNDSAARDTGNKAGYVYYQNITATDATDAEAQAAAMLPAAIATCSTTPPPSGCSIQIGDLSCPILIGGSLPAVGSAEWCQCIAAVANWLSSIGNAFLTQIQGQLDPTNPDSILAPLLAIGQGTAILSLGTLTPDSAKQVLSRVTEDIHCYWEAFFQTITKVGGVNGVELLGLSICRTLLRVFHKLRVGWDIAAWATFDLSIEVRPLEKLLDYMEHYMFQWEIPGVGEAIDCYLNSTAPQGQVQCWMAMHGANWDVYKPVIDAKREKLSTVEFIQAARRSGIGDDTIAADLTARGWYRNSEAVTRVQLYDELPTIGQVLHFLQRNVFDEQYVSDFGLMDGFEDRFWPRYGPGLRALGMTEQTARDEYAAHWINPSLGELFNMVKRLRPGAVADNLVFTQDDLLRVMQEQDIAGYFRERLAAISYRPKSIIYIRRLAQYGEFDRRKIESAYQDQGYSPDDAAEMATQAQVQAARMNETAINGYTAHFISELSEEGMVSKAEALGHLAPQGFTASQVDVIFDAAAKRKSLKQAKAKDAGTINEYASVALHAYESGAIDATQCNDALLAAGYTAASAPLAIQTVDIRVRSRQVDETIRAIKRSFFLGAVDASTALQALLTSGVAQVRGTQIVAGWQIEMSVPRVAAATAAILRWSKKGIISVSNAAIRLGNLGWLPGDIDLALLEVEQEVQAAAAASRARTAKALAAAQKKAQAALKATQRESCRIYTPGKMIRWYKLRIIDDAEFTRRLTQCGYDTDAIAGLLREASVARDAADKKAEKSGATGVEYTGPGAVPGGPTNGTSGAGG